VEQARQGVNNSGVVTGTSYDAQGNFFGFVWKSGKMTKMGTLGGPWSQGYAINNKARLRAWAIRRTVQHMLRCKLRKLPVEGSRYAFSGSTSTVWGFGINDLGASWLASPRLPGHITLTSIATAKIKDLNGMIPAGSGWVLIDAQGINAGGQIVGMGTHNGQEHAFFC